MKVDGQEVTLHDIERTMLSLYWDKNISESDKDHLMDQYKEERMRYMDSIFPFTETNRKQLEKAEALFIQAQQRMEEVRQHLLETELQKRKQGLKAAQRFALHLEIWDREDTEERCYSDEECDLWGVLCGEEHRYTPFWGVMKDHVYVNEKELEDNNLPQQRLRNPILEDRLKEKQTNGLGKDFCYMKESYKLSWQDMTQISRFTLTVKMYYDN